jgi:hypothetical protein
MEQQFRPGAFADLNLRPVDIDLPISGGIRYQSMPDGSVVEVDLNKTFENQSGSIRPSIGYTDERSGFSDGPADISNRAKTVRVGVDGNMYLMDGDLELSGYAMGSRTRSNQDVNIPSFNQSFSDSNVGTFTKIGIGARMGLFDINASRQKGTGSDPFYSGTVGMNVGKGGRIEYSDTNVGDPTIGFNYRMDF